MWVPGSVIFLIPWLCSPSACSTRRELARTTNKVSYEALRSSDEGKSDECQCRGTKQ